MARCTAPVLPTIESWRQYPAQGTALVDGPREGPSLENDPVGSLHRVANGLPGALNNAAVAALVTVAPTGRSFLNGRSTDSLATTQPLPQ
jgi:hypothetical protein